MIDSDSRQNAEPSRASDAIEAVALEALGPGAISEFPVFRTQGRLMTAS